MNTRPESSQMSLRSLRSSPSRSMGNTRGNVSRIQLLCILLVAALIAVGVSRVVLGTPWHLVSKVDREEVYAPLHIDAWMMAADLTVLFLGLMLVGGLIWRERRRQLLQRQLQTEHVLRAQQARLQFLLTSTPAVIYSLRLGHNFATTFLSDNVTSMTGYSPQEFMDDPGFWERHLHPNDVPAAKADMEAVAKTNTPLVREYRFLHSDGRYRWVHDEARIICDDSGGASEIVGYWIDITNQRKALDELSHSRDCLARAEQLAHLGSWEIDLLENRRTWSDEVFRILEIDPAQCASPYEAFLGLIHPEDRDTVDRAYRDPPSSRSPYRIQYRLSFPGGRIKHVEESREVICSADGTPLRSGGTLQDITAKVLAQEKLESFNAELEQQVAERTSELAASNHGVRALLLSIPDMVMRLRADGSLLYSQDAQGSPGLNAVTCDTSGLMVRALDCGKRALAKGSTVYSEAELNLPSGQITIELRATPMSGDEFVVFIRDITARRHLETEIAATLAKEREVSEMKTRFISVTSHEFRTPMATALGSTELLFNHLDQLSQDKQRELLGRVTGSLVRMNEMLDDLLLLNRMEARRMEPRIVPVDVSAFTKSLLEEVSLADRAAHHFEFRTEGSVKDAITDPNILRHILTNLLNNAVRYSPPGTTVLIMLCIDAEGVRLTIEDEGIGIPLADSARIFEPFERASNVGSIKGTGLGLNIVKRMTELLGGTIVLDLECSKGARFILHLPAPRPQPGVTIQNL